MASDDDDEFSFDMIAELEQAKSSHSALEVPSPSSDPAHLLRPFVSPLKAIVSAAASVEEHLVEATRHRLSTGYSQPRRSSVDESPAIEHAERRRGSSGIVPGRLSIDAGHEHGRQRGSSVERPRAPSVDKQHHLDRPRGQSVERSRGPSIDPLRPRGQSVERSRALSTDPLSPLRPRGSSMEHSKPRALSSVDRDDHGRPRGPSMDQTRSRGQSMDQHHHSLAPMTPSQAARRPSTTSHDDGGRPRRSSVDKPRRMSIDRFNPLPMRQRSKRGLPPDHILSQQVQHTVLPRATAFLTRLERIGDTLLHRASRANKKYKTQVQPKVQRLRPKQTGRILLGLLLMVFGERFAMTFAIIEAFRHGSSGMFVSSIQTLVDQVRAVKKAAAEDAQVDEDGNGIPDVLELSDHERVRRRIRVAIQAVDPLIVRNAVQSMWTSFISAAASVKVETARSVSFGMSLGNDMEALLNRFILPEVEVTLEAEEIDTKWTPFLASILTKVFGVFIAFLFAPIVSVLATSLRGSSLFVSGIEELSMRHQEEQGLEGKRFGETKAAILFALAFAASVIIQVSLENHKAPALWVHVLLFPMFFVEYSIEWLVNMVKTDAERFLLATGKA